MIVKTPFSFARKGGDILFALDVLVQLFLSNRTSFSIQYLFPFSLGTKFSSAYIDVEMSVFAGDDLHPGHDMIE
jgi:hypothetical protein